MTRGMVGSVAEGVAVGGIRRVVGSKGASAGGVDVEKGAEEEEEAVESTVGVAEVGAEFSSRFSASFVRGRRRILASTGRSVEVTRARRICKEGIGEYKTRYEAE